MSTNAEILAQWLRDAHAMEEQAESMLKAQASRLENYPELKARIEQHLVETQHQGEKLKGLLDDRGGRSLMKDMGGKVMANMQGLAGSMAADEVVKGASASYAFENFEIAAYRSLIGAAEACGDTQVKTVAEGILKEEQAMASWLEDHLPGIVKTYLQREAAGAEYESKR